MTVINQRNNQAALIRCTLFLHEYIIAVLPQRNTNSKDAKAQTWSSSVTKWRNVDHMTSELKKPLGSEPKHLHEPTNKSSCPHLTFLPKNELEPLHHLTSVINWHHNQFSRVIFFATFHEQKLSRARLTQSGHYTHFSLNKLFFWNKFGHLLKTPGGSFAWQPDWM